MHTLRMARFRGVGEVGGRLGRQDCKPIAHKQMTALHKGAPPVKSMMGGIRRGITRHPRIVLRKLQIRFEPPSEGLNQPDAGYPVGGVG